MRMCLSVSFCWGEWALVVQKRIGRDIQRHALMLPFDAHTPSNCSDHALFWHAACDMCTTDVRVGDWGARAGGTNADRLQHPGGTRPSCSGSAQGKHLTRQHVGCAL